MFCHDSEIVGHFDSIGLNEYTDFTKPGRALLSNQAADTKDTGSLLLPTVLYRVLMDVVQPREPRLPEC